jgi:hypothetical protein
MYTASQCSITSSSLCTTWWPLAAANASARAVSGSYTPARTTGAPLPFRLLEW